MLLIYQHLHLQKNLNRFLAAARKWSIRLQFSILSNFNNNKRETRHFKQEHFQFSIRNETTQTRTTMSYLPEARKLFPVKTPIPRMDSLPFRSEKVQRSKLTTSKISPLALKSTRTALINASFTLNNKAS